MDNQQKLATIEVRKKILRSIKKHNPKHWQKLVEEAKRVGDDIELEIQ